MKLEINGEWQDVEVKTLKDLIEYLDYGDAIVATARNGAFVRATERAKIALEPDDRIEILVPRQGG